MVANEKEGRPGSHRAARQSYVPTDELMPPVPIGRALTFGALAAIAGALAWGLVAYFAHVEIGWLAWGIGVGVGAATVRAGGHGGLVAAIAGALALLAIGTGKHLTFTLAVDRAVHEVTQKIDGDALDEHRADAAAWVQLGDAPTDDEIRGFLRKRSFRESDPARFRSENGPELRRFHAEQPTLEQWRASIAGEMAAGASFVDALREDFAPADIVFALLGIASAFALVNRHTQQLRVAARQAARTERAQESGDDA